MIDPAHQRALRQFTERATQPRRVRPIRNPLPARVPPGAVYVGRPGWGLGGSPYANPHRVGQPCRMCGGHVHDRADAVDAYRQHLRARPELVVRARVELAGRDLACWCPLPAAGGPDVCHAAVLLDVAAGGQP